MDEAGAANETIRQQTGWFKGMDGKWHYFVNDIYFAEYGSEALIPYTVSINVKEKADGNFFYSFSAERSEKNGEPSTQRTLHAVVNSSDESAANGNLSEISVPNPDGNVKRQMSISPSVSRKNVAEDLRTILNRGGDVSELRRYISQLERGDTRTERTGRNAYTTASGKLPMLYPIPAGREIGSIPPQSAGNQEIQTHFPPPVPDGGILTFLQNRLYCIYMNVFAKGDSYAENH